MIILENVKEQLEKHKNTLCMIKECLWRTKTQRRTLITKKTARKSKLLWRYWKQYKSWSTNKVQRTNFG